ncbi:hypothetical protein M758_2G048200 [Ceratodon purpureus]|nr:hypothetical protein M758_2G048200 [Ceratodon purpureus]
MLLLACILNVLGMEAADGDVEGRRQMTELMVAITDQANVSRSGVVAEERAGSTIRLSVCSNARVECSC